MQATARAIIGILDRLEPRERLRTINALIHRLDASDMQIEESETSWPEVASMTGDLRIGYHAMVARHRRAA